MKKVECYYKEAIEKAINGLSRAFAWRSSEEGWDYWEEVRNKLIAIRDFMDNPKKLCPHCSKEIEE